MSRKGAVTAKIDPASLRELEKALAAYTDDLELAARAAVAFTAEAVAALEISLVPVETGALMRGIDVAYSNGGLGARVGPQNPDLYYAIFVEWGTTARPPVPFATPAAERARVEFASNLRAQIAKAV